MHSFGIEFAGFPNPSTIQTLMLMMWWVLPAGIVDFIDLVDMLLAARGTMQYHFERSDDQMELDSDDAHICFPEAMVKRGRARPVP